MTAIYHATPGHIVEQPAMEKPEKPLKPIFRRQRQAYYDDMGEYDRKMTEYNAHLAQCRTIPAHDSARSLWKDGQKLVDGRDYEVLTTCKLYATPQKIPDHYCMDCRLKAFPLPVKSEDDLWDEFLDCAYEATGLMVADYPAAIAYLKQKYIITKR